MNKKIKILSSQPVPNDIKSHLDKIEDKFQIVFEVTHRKILENINAFTVYPYLVDCPNNDQYGLALGCVHGICKDDNMSIAAQTDAMIYDWFPNSKLLCVASDQAGNWLIFDGETRTFRVFDHEEIPPSKPSELPFLASSFEDILKNLYGLGKDNEEIRGYQLSDLFLEALATI